MKHKYILLAGIIIFCFIGITIIGIGAFIFLKSESKPSQITDNKPLTTIQNNPLTTIPQGSTTLKGNPKVIVEDFVIASKEEASFTPISILVKNTGDCLIYRSYIRASVKDDNNNLLAVSNDGVGRVGPPVSTIFLLPPGESFIYQPAFSGLDETKISKVEVYAEPDCISSDRYNKNLYEIKSYSLKKGEYSWSILGELEQSEDVNRSLEVAVIITNNQGKLINAGYEVISNIPPSTQYPFDVGLITREEGNIRIVAFPITLR